MRIEDHPMKMIMNLSNLIRRAMEQEMIDLELTSIQSRVLGFLWWRKWEKKPVFQRELEEELKIRRSSVTSVVQCLEKKGLLERKSVSQDARQKELVLTDKGMCMQSQVIDRLDAMEKKILGWMTDEEWRWMVHCVQKLENGLKEADYD